MNREFNIINKLILNENLTELNGPSTTTTSMLCSKVHFSNECFWL